MACTIPKHPLHFKADHALLQEINIDTILKDVCNAFEELKAQAQKSVLGVDENTAEVQEQIKYWEGKEGGADTADHLRARLVEMTQTAANKGVEREMSRVYDIFQRGLYEWVLENHPYAAEQFSAAEAASGAHATLPA